MLLFLHCLGSFEGPSGITADASGNVFISESTLSRIQRCNSSGCLEIGNGYGTGMGPTYFQFNSPTGLAVDTSGKLYVADTANNRIQQCTITGNAPTVTCVQINPAFTFAAPAAVAVDSATTYVYAVDSNNYVVKCRYTGSSWVCSRQGSARLSGAAGITFNGGITGAGPLFIADTGHDRILSCTVGGVCTTIVGGSGPGTSLSEVNGPTSVNFDSSGNMYVLDSGNNRILKFTGSGTSWAPATQ